MAFIGEEANVNQLKYLQTHLGIEVVAQTKDAIQFVTALSGLPPDQLQNLKSLLDKPSEFKQQIQQLVGEKAHLGQVEIIHRDTVLQIHLKPEPVYKGSNLGRLIREYYRAQATIKLPIFEQAQHVKDSYINLTLVKKVEQTFYERECLDPRTLKDDNFYETERYYPHEDIYRVKNTVSKEDIFAADVKSKKLPSVIVVGRAGIGKTTFCKYVTYKWAEGNYWNQFDVVYWIQLRHVLTFPKKAVERFGIKDLAKCIAYVFDKQTEDIKLTKNIKNKDIQKQLDDENQKKLLLLDGFDEVVGLIEDKKGQFVGQFLEYVLNNSQLNYLMTSRPHALEELPSQLRFKIPMERYYELMGFTDENIPNYIEQTMHLIGRKEDIAQLIKLLKENKSIWGIAHIPINLALICSVRTTDMLKELDKVTVTALYERLVHQLFKANLAKITSQTQIEKLDDNKKNLSENSLKKFYQVVIKIFGELAYQGLLDNNLLFSYDQIRALVIKHSKDLGRFIEQLKIAGQKSIIEPSKIQWIIEQLMHFGFINVLRLEKEDISQASYSFIHLTFQEYFAAQYIYAGLCHQSDTQSVVIFDDRNFIDSSKYQQMLTFISGIISLNTARNSRNMAYDSRIFDNFIRNVFKTPFSEIVEQGHVKLFNLILEEYYSNGYQNGNILNDAIDSYANFINNIYDVYDADDKEKMKVKLTAQYIENLIALCREIKFESIKLVNLFSAMSAFYFFSCFDKNHKTNWKEDAEKMSEDALNLAAKFKDHSKYRQVYSKALFSRAILSRIDRENVKDLERAKEDIKTAISSIPENDWVQKTIFMHKQSGILINLGRKENNNENLLVAHETLQKSLNQISSRNYENDEKIELLKARLNGELADVCIRLGKQDKIKSSLDCAESIFLKYRHGSILWIYNLAIKYYLNDKTILKFGIKNKAEEYCLKAINILYDSELYQNLGIAVAATIDIFYYYALIEKRRNNILMANAWAEKTIYSIEEKGNERKERLDHMNKIIGEFNALTQHQDEKQLNVHYVIISSEHDRDPKKRGGIGTYCGILANELALINNITKIHWVSFQQDEEGKEDLGSKICRYYLPIVSQDNKVGYANQFSEITRKAKEIIFDIRNNDSNATIVIESQEMRGLSADLFADLKKESNHDILMISRVHSPIAIQPWHESMQLSAEDRRIYIEREVKQFKYSDLISYPSMYIYNKVRYSEYFSLNDYTAAHLVVPNFINEPECINSDYMLAINELAKTKDQWFDKEYRELSPKNFNIFIVGRIEERKGVKIILKCVKHVVKRIPNAHFYFFGQYATSNGNSGFLLDPFDLFNELQIKEEYLKHIHFTNHIDREILMKILPFGDIFPIVFYNESFSMTVVEIALLKKPMIVWPRSGVREIVKRETDDFFCLTVTAELDKEIVEDTKAKINGVNIDKVAEAFTREIISYHDNPEKGNALAIRLEAHVRDDFLASNIVPRILTSYRAASVLKYEGELLHKVTEQTSQSSLLQSRSSAVSSQSTTYSPFWDKSSRTDSSDQAASLEPMKASHPTGHSNFESLKSN